MSDPSISRRIRTLTRPLTTARPHLPQWEKCAAGDGRPSLGLRPRSVRPPPAHSHPDCRSRLTLIVARQRFDESFLITCSSGTPSTWNGSWKSSEFITTAIVFTSRSVAALPEKDLANRRQSMPPLNTTLGGAIAAVCSRCQSPRNYEFAMDKWERQRKICDPTTPVFRKANHRAA